MSETTMKSEKWLARGAQIYSESTGETIALIPHIRCDDPTPDSAKLMAGAPEMLRALMAVVALLDGRQPKDIPGAIMAAQYAINKATT